MVKVLKFAKEFPVLAQALKTSKKVLITAPALADGDSIGSQLALRAMIRERYGCVVEIVNEEPLPERYLFLPEVSTVETFESYMAKKPTTAFDLGIIVDGGIDRAGRVKDLFDLCKTKVFIDHHSVSVEYPYDIKIVEDSASATTELVYHLSQTQLFSMPISINFAEWIYLGLIFDTGFFRHTNTTPEALELAAKLLRTGFNFTRVGEQGMLSRTFSSLQLLAKALSESTLVEDGKTIWSSITQKSLKDYGASPDDREGIIDQMFLTEGVELAILFIELSSAETKVSLRSRGDFNVASFARSLSECGGGHSRASGANIKLPLDAAVQWVLGQLTVVRKKVG